MKKMLFLFLLPLLLFAEISNDLFRDCSNGNYKACSTIGSMRMNKYSPDYNPSLALDYLSSACHGSVSAGCFNLGLYYSSKGDNDRSMIYFKKSCDLGDYVGCARYRNSTVTSPVASSLDSAHQYEQNGDIVKALYSYKKSCQDGVIASCNRYNQLYSQYRGGSR